MPGEKHYDENLQPLGWMRYEEAMQLATTGVAVRPKDCAEIVFFVPQHVMDGEVILTHLSMATGKLRKYVTIEGCMWMYHPGKGKMSVLSATREYQEAKWVKAG